MLPLARMSLTGSYPIIRYPFRQSHLSVDGRADGQTDKTGR